MTCEVCGQPAAMFPARGYQGKRRRELLRHSHTSQVRNSSPEKAGAPLKGTRPFSTGQLPRVGVITGGTEGARSDWAVGKTSHPRRASVSGSGSELVCACTCVQMNTYFRKAVVPANRGKNLTTPARTPLTAVREMRNKYYIHIQLPEG